LTDEEYSAASYDLARKLLRYGIAETAEWAASDDETDREEGTTRLDLLQNAFYLAEVEISKELDDMRDELIDLGLSPAELDRATAEKLT
jgi:hypothetical protein